ncbi:unnamed protein product [Musa acuminata subsp. malaccensis]|uniref:(wild Malaysian banana) hypothetical protein n=1 Tax=Musa acuminata subsp. malaccensis TaxID=214687 RepID=A0A804J3U0_MUSAM|nr:unnamed protein product [Musa acuminata subsp. malaccensis]
MLVWSSDDFAEESYDGCGYFWLPVPPEGYQALDYFVTRRPNEPSVEEVRCVQTSLRVAKMMFEYWIDLLDDDRNSLTKKGNIDRAELYVHVKPAFGGTFSDIANVDLPPLH